MIFLVSNAIFHFGDDVYTGESGGVLIDLLVNCVGAFVGFGLSLLIYWHQIKKEKKKEEVEAKTIRKALLHYYSALIGKNLRIAEKNLELVDAYSEKQRQDFGSLEILPRVPSHDFKRLINVDNKGVFEAWCETFKEEDSVKQYQLTNSYIDLVDGVINEVHRMHKFVTEHSYTRLLEVKRIVDDLPDRIGIISRNIYLEVGRKAEDDPFYQKLNTLLKLYGDLASQRAPISKFMEEFVLPVLKAFHSEFGATPYSVEMTMICKKVRVQFHDIKIDVESLVDDFKKIRGKVNEAFEFLQKKVEELDKITS